MTTGWYSLAYAPSPSLDLFGPAVTYFLSDGSSWNSGAGTFFVVPVHLLSVEVSGSTVRYYFAPPPDSVAYEQTDFDSGNHSSAGTLQCADPLMLEATLGSSEARLRGRVTVVANDPTSYGDRFNYFSAGVGAVVPFEITYLLNSPGGWTADVFDRPISYQSSGHVWFTRSVPSSPLEAVSIVGPDEVWGLATFQYTAAARFADGRVKDVSAAGTWTVDKGALATIQKGLLTTEATPAGPENLTIGVSYTEGGTTRESQRVVVYHASDPAPESPTWTMYQGNPFHTGHVPVTLRVPDFQVLWQKGFERPLNPVTAIDGLVFCTLQLYFHPITSLFALDAITGSVVWSKRFDGTYAGPGVFSVNPPSCGDGKVYVQTCDHAPDTWLHAFDATTGNELFRSPHAAQWEHYLAPTLYDDKVYVDGGSYGGMYGFDARTGARLWFTDLPQYDDWTPAVDRERTYAYMQGGLFVLRRDTGALDYTIADRRYQWDGYAMRMAPALGVHAVAIVAHDGRLLSFDLASHRIRWELKREFRGQASLAHGAVYVVDGSRVVVLD